MTRREKIRIRPIARLTAAFVGAMAAFAALPQAAASDEATLARHLTAYSEAVAENRFLDAAAAAEAAYEAGRDYFEPGDPNLTQLAFNLGETRVAVARYSDAVAPLTEAVDGFDGAQRQAAILLLAEAYHYAGDSTGALRTIAGALAAEDAVPEAQARALLLFRKGLLYSLFSTASYRESPVVPELAVPVSDLPAGSGAVLDAYAAIPRRLEALAADAPESAAALAARAEFLRLAADFDRDEVEAAGSFRLRQPLPSLRESRLLVEAFDVLREEGDLGPRLLLRAYAGYIRATGRLRKESRQLVADGLSVGRQRLFGSAVALVRPIIDMGREIPETRTEVRIVGRMTAAGAIEDATIAEVKPSEEAAGDYPEACLASVAGQIWAPAMVDGKVVEVADYESVCIFNRG